MLDDRPLPPNWESRLDPSTQQWFFVDHVNKKTSWDDPRPAYYSARQRKRSTSMENRTSESQSPTLDASYASLVSDYEKGTSPSPQENECDSREEELMEYLRALRAAYPDYKDRQLAKLMEKWLGDSASLRKFVATHLKRKVSSSSEMKAKRASGSNTQKSDSLKNHNSPHSTAGQEETGETSRPTDRNVPPFASHASESMSLSAIQSTESENTREPSKPEQKDSGSLSLSGTFVATSSKTSQLMKLSVNSAPNKSRTESTRHGIGTDSIMSVIPQSSDTSPVTELLGGNANTRTLNHVTRCIARGSDSQLRGPRLVPRGPNPDLVRGPDPNLHRGPDRSLLARHTTDSSGVTATTSTPGFDIFKSILT